MNGSGCLHLTGIKRLALTEEPHQKMAGKNEKSQILLRKARNQLFESPDVWNLSTGLSSLCRHQLPEFLQANTPELLGDILDLPPSKYFLFYLQGVLTNVICVPGEH